jgi:hypothetical protein
MPQLSSLASTLKAPALPQPQASSGAPAASSGASSITSSGEWDFSFHNLLSIINPLQHLPVISTLYRAITGDTIGTPEKIAGDTLYGGLWGAVASIVDSAFQAVTGKDVGDTVLAFFTGNHGSTPVVVASNSPPKLVAASPDASFTALQASLVQKGVDNDIAQRALAAYQKSMLLPGTVLAAAQ